MLEARRMCAHFLQQLGSFTLVSRSGKLKRIFNRGECFLLTSQIGIQLLHRIVQLLNASIAHVSIFGESLQLLLEF